MKKITLMIFMGLLSLCGYSQALPMEDFEDPWTPSGPTASWGIYQNTFGTIEKWRQTDGTINEPGFGGTGFAAFVNNQNVPTGNVAQDWLVTPSFIMPINGQLRFQSRLAFNGNQGGVYKVLIAPVGADLSVLSSYTVVNTWTEPGINPNQQQYNEVLVNLPGVVGQSYHVAFLMEADNADRWFVDNVTVVERCLPPTNLGVNGVTATSANLTWTSPAAQFEVEYMPSANAPTGSGTVVTGNTFPAAPLLPTTSYKFYVRAICGVGNTSDWAGPFAFNTTPVNDACSGAIMLTVNPTNICTTSTPGTINAATASPEANTCGGTDDDDVWYQFVATNTTHLISLNNVVGNTDLFHVVYSGSVCGSLTQLLCSDPNTSTVTGLTVGQTYTIRVYTWTATANQASTFNICIGTPPPPPTNDHCATPTVVPVNPDLTCAQFVTSTLYSSTASPEANTCIGTDDDDVWFEFTATNTAHTINLNNVTGSTTDLMHVLYTGNNCGSLTQLYCSDPNNSVATNLTIGQVYKIRVYTWTATINQTSVFDVCIGTPPPPPANDNCSGAVMVPVNPDMSCALTTPGTIAWATGSLTPANTCTGTADDDVWYQFVATGPVHSINFNNVTGSTTLLAHSVYSGAACGSLTLLNCATANSSVIGGLTAGQTYTIRVFSQTNILPQTTTFNLCIGVPPPPPANDNCATATVVPVNPTLTCAQTVPGTLAWATASAENNTCGGTDDDDVWYQFVATSTQHTINLNNVAGSTTDLFHAVYSGNICGTLTQLYCSDPNNSVASNLTIGATYKIRVYSWTATPGQTSTFDVCVGTPPPPPANDNCSGAIVATVNPTLVCTTVTPGTINWSTASVEGNTCGGTDDDDVWYEFTATNPIHTINFNNVTGNTDLFHVLYSGNNCGTLTQLYCSDPNNSIATGLTVGQVYKIRVYTWTSTPMQSSTFDLCIGTPPPPPVNDNCASATVVPVNADHLCGQITPGTIAWSTASPEANTCGGTLDDDDVWYEFTATSTNHIISFLNVTGTALGHALYTGNVCGSLTQIYCNTTNMSFPTGLTIGQTYKVRVYSNSTLAGQTTTYNICIGTPPPPPANDNCATATVVPVNATPNCVLTVPGTIFSATASTEANTCATNQDDDDIWYEFVATNTTHTISLLNITGSTTALSHVLYSGNICGTLTQVYCSTALTSFAQGLTVGQTYKIRVYSTTATINQTSAFDVCVATPPPPPANDDCANATIAPVNAGADCDLFSEGTIYSATASPEGNTCGGTDDDDVWFEFTALSTTHFINLYDVTGSTTDLFHVLYSGDICGSLTQIYCSDNNSSLATGLTVGGVYKLRVYSWTATANQTSAFKLCIGTPTNPITVNDTTFTVEQLVQNVLISSDCALVTNITSSTGSNFGQANGIGYFSQNNSNFPFADGVILATSAITAAPGPYPGGAEGAQLSPPWGGDADLSALIAVGGNTDPIHNATKLEFDFVPLTNVISFDFLFASDEYGTFQCNYSDAFAFILTNLDDPDADPVNLAVIPGTTVPVSVVNIHDDSNTQCDAANEEYFGAMNSNNVYASSTGYVGQTTVMTALGNVTPGTNYHIKLVIADYRDTAFNSAVFIAGGSFDLGDIDLGDNFVIDEGTAVCGQSETTLHTNFDDALYDFVWSVTDENGVETILEDETGPDLVVTAPGGTYHVAATFTGTTCTLNGEVIVEFYPDETSDPVDLTVGCDPNDTGIAEFDMSTNTALMLSTVDDPANYEITYHLTEADALSGDGDLTEVYTNVTPFTQTIFVRIVRVETGCVTVKQFNLIVEDHTPTFDMPEDFSICEGTTGVTIEVLPVDFDPASPDVTIAWTFNGAPLADTDLVVDVNPNVSGDYEVTITNLGCTATGSVTVTVIPTPVVDTIEDIAVCDVYVLPALSPGNQYFTLPDGNGDELFANEEIDATQTVYIFAESGTNPNCTAQSEFTVTVNNSPEFSLGGPYVVCDYTTVTLTVTPAEGSVWTNPSYEWIYAGDVVGTTSSIQGVGFGEYTVTVTDGACSTTHVVEINKDTTPLTFTLGGPYEVCNPELQTIVITDPNFDLNIAHYAWTLDGVSVGEDSPEIQATGFGRYEVTVTIGECLGTSWTDVKENTAGFEVAYEAGCDGTNFVISAEPTLDELGVPSFDVNGATYSWTGPNGFTSSEASSIITHEGIYTVTVTTAEGCVSQASLNAESTTCLIPNGISPNGDGMNDEFDLTGFNVAKLSIFNRYGREVYSKTQYTKEWHGQEDNGNELPTGTYYYMIERNNGDTKTGWVYINRQEN